jgi:predicted choloylglycine hydrolase
MNTIEQLEVSGSHREIGRSIGLHFAGAIQRLFDNYDFLQEHLLPFLNSSAGQGLFQSYLALHRTQFPQYIAELEGMADGSGRPFEEIFAVNLRGEFAGLIAATYLRDEEAHANIEGCTDCLVVTPDAALIGHNEDGPPAGYGNMYVVHVTIDDNPTFKALSYPGFLPGNAFGFNESGILHSINHVAPRPIQVGLSRHFLARALLDARTLDDAIRTITRSDRASGFNYNIGSLSERRVICVEVSPERYHVHDVQGCYTHTNHYIQLNDQKQEISPSSRKRLERSRTFCSSTPSANSEHVLAMLGDQTDRDFPIYRDATAPDNDATLCSALYNLDRRELRIFWGHPVKEPDKSMTLAL